MRTLRCHTSEACERIARLRVEFGSRQQDLESLVEANRKLQTRAEQVRGSIFYVLLYQ